MQTEPITSPRNAAPRTAAPRKVTPTRRRTLYFATLFVAATWTLACQPSTEHDTLDPRATASQPSTESKGTASSADKDKDEPQAKPQAEPLDAPPTAPAVTEPAVDDASLGPFVAFQSGRKTQGIRLPGLGADGGAKLVNLAPASGEWFVLEITSAPGKTATYHLERLGPRPLTLRLVSNAGGSLRIVRDGKAILCSPWSGEAGGELEQARNSGLPMAPICERNLYLRNPATGRRSNIEKVTDFLRDRVRGGEKITTFVRDTVFKDKYLQRGSVQQEAHHHAVPEGSPPPVAMQSSAADSRVSPSGLALALNDVDNGRLEVGQWYAATGVPGVFVSTLQPAQTKVDKSIERAAGPLDEIEASALTYLVAFDLAQHRLGFAVGTDHPRVEWSERVAESFRSDDPLGPDGFQTIAPLARTGILAPFKISRVSATFTGGFKRSHGAFKYGALAQQNHGSHYGFIESGTILSSLQPDLATVVTWNDGQSELLTWRQELDVRLPEVLHARQNGVPLVEIEPATGQPRLGALVRRWSEGNWSGSENKQLRTLRAGMCQVETPDHRYLVYGYFSGATPAAMARVFVAAGCNYAMHLDMNALEHTYLALYRSIDGRFMTEHLIDGMSVLDPEKAGASLPRFIAVPDNRDFFYMLQREVRP